MTAGVLVWIWNAGFELSAYFDSDHNNFFQSKLIFLAILGTFVIGLPIRLWYGGIAISSDGLQIRSPKPLFIFIYSSVALYLLLEIIHILIHGFSDSWYLKLQATVIFSSITLFILFVIANFSGVFRFTRNGIEFRDWRNEPKWSDIHSFLTVQNNGSRLAIEYNGTQKWIGAEFRRPRQIIGHPFEVPPEEMADLLNAILEKQKSAMLTSRHSD